ncbi:MAG: hypothetical protein LBL66_06060 [Clostridiales bacterium]|jgi:putative aldouronate transport system substrate-binding protein|nr:hypothetical protein [Clostridiales bacterium]
MKTGKRKPFRAALAAISAMLILPAFAFLPGCGGKNYDSNNFLPNGTEGNPYQIVRDPVTLKIFVPVTPTNPPFGNLKMFKKLSEMTNLKFEFIEADLGAYQNMRAAAWDSGDLPDLFLYNNGIEEQVSFQPFGAHTPFNDPNLQVEGVGDVGSLIDNYMPVYKKLLDENFNITTDEDAKKIATLPDGKMYSALSVNDVPRDLSFKMFINQKWIDALQAEGWDIKDADGIKTTDDYLAVLRAFRDGDPNHNGRTGKDNNDEIGVGAMSVNYLRNFILGAYGYVSAGVEVENDGSAMTFVPTTDAYRQYLKFMRSLFGEKLIHSDVYSISTDAQLAQKGMEYRLGSFCSAAAYLTVGYEYESEYVTFGPLTSEYYAGDPIQWRTSPVFQPTGAVIPSGTKKVREAARLLDIMYSDVGCQLLAYGEEGVDFVWDDAEKTSWTFQVPPTWTGNQEAYRATLTPHPGSGSGLYWKYGFVGKMNDPIITALNRMSERYQPYLKTPVPPAMKMTSAEYDEVILLRTDIEQQVKYWETEFAKGSQDAADDKDWSDFTALMKQYRCERFAEIYNGAYARYKNA